MSIRKSVRTLNDAERNDWGARRRGYLCPRVPIMMWAYRGTV